MRTGGENPTAEHAALALYLLGALDEGERVLFEEHLAGCWECLSAAGDMGSVTSALGGLDEADWNTLATLPPEFAEFDPTRAPTGDTEWSGAPVPGLPTLGRTQPTPTDPGAPLPDALPKGAAPKGVAATGRGAGADGAGARPEPAHAEAPDVGPGPLDAGSPAAPAAEPTPGGAGPDDEPSGPQADAAPAEPGPRGSRRGTGARVLGSIGASGGRSGTRPAGSRSRPPGAARRRKFMMWGGVAAAAVAVVLAGGIVTTVGLDDRDALVLTATGEARDQGISLSVSITTDGDQSSTIRITATGLRQGLRYRLFAVTRDGATHVVRDWTASTGTQQVTGQLAQPVDDLAFITVGLVDGTAIVTAPISR
ncbi:zf-HC2 domain-containing protein [Micromonospora sp. SH-82]|uniref:zf-HC2 domain-containing protein n=1 Tax=Micromonospora sp. SH-82 TaxID=3132938 RepID=UPI003EB97E40